MSQVAELKRLMASPGSLPDCAPQGACFWESLALGSPLLASFSSEALRQKAKRLKLHRTPMSGHKRQAAPALWSEGQLAELAELVGRQGHLPQYFWRDLPAASRSLSSFSKEALRMKARRLGLLEPRSELPAIEPPAGQEAREPFRSPEPPEPVPSPVDVSKSLPSVRQIGTWTASLEAELHGALSHGASHVPGFWQRVREEHPRLAVFTAEALRQKARRLRAQASVGGCLAPSASRKLEAEGKNATSSAQAQENRTPADL